MRRSTTSHARARTSRVLLVLSAATLATACGGDGDPTRTTRAPQPAPKGEISKATADPTLTEGLGDAAQELTAAGCVFGVFDEEEAVHVDEDQELKSGTFPPTSGQHFATWAPFGLYDKELEDGFVVHNLEHGGVAVWHGPKVPDATVDAVAKLLDDEEKWVVAPRSDIDGLYAAAWAVGLSCTPEAVERLGPEKTADLLDTWYETVVSTGSDAEKDVPAVPGGMKEPTPIDDISAPSS